MESFKFAGAIFVKFRCDVISWIGLCTMNSLYVRDTKKKKIHENWATTNDNHFKVDQYYVVPGKLLLLKKIQNN